jgi:hypothetical protein
MVANLVTAAFYHGILTLGNVDTVLNYRGIFVTVIVLP